MMVYTDAAIGTSCITGHKNRTSSRATATTATTATTTTATTATTAICGRLR